MIEEDEEALGHIIAGAHSKEARERHQAISAARAFIEGHHASLEAAAGSLAAALVPALSDANPKVAQGSLELLCTLVDQLGAAFAPYLAALWSPLLERLGDAKAGVRERAIDLAVGAGTHAVPAAEALEQLRPGFDHRNWRVRESTLLVLARTLAAHEEGSSGLPLKPLVPLAARLLEDGQPSVREAAALALENSYRHCGDALISDVQKLDIRPAVLRHMLSRLGLREDEEPRANVGLSVGGLTSSSFVGSAPSGSSAPSRGSSHPPSPPTAVVRQGSGSCARRAGSWGAASDGSDGTSTSLGGASAEDGAVKAVRVYSDRELSRELTTIVEQLRNESDWSVRQKALVRLRALVAGGACELDSWADGLKTLREPFIAQITELRSSLVKESCRALEGIALAMRGGFEPFVDAFLPPLMKNTVVTIAVISQSSHTAIVTILLASPTPKAMPKLLGGLTDRSATLRTRCAEYMTRLLYRLPVAAEGERSVLEKHLEAIAIALRPALSDALSEVRSHARAAYWAFSRHAPSRAAKLLSSLDAPTQKMTLEERPHSDAAFEQHLAQHGHLPPAQAAALLASRHPGRANSPALPHTGAHSLTRANSTPDLASAAAAPAVPLVSEVPGIRGPGGAYPDGGKPPRNGAPSLGGARRVSSGRSLADRGGNARRPPAHPSAQGGGGGGLPGGGGGKAVVKRPASVSLAGDAGYRGETKAPPGGNHADGERSGLAHRTPVLVGEDEGIESTRASGTGEGSAAGGGMSSESPSNLLSGLSSPVWSVRVASCAGLRAIIAGERIVEVAPLLERLATASLERLNDPHHKVVQAALLLVRDTLLAFPSAYDALAERLLPPLLSRLHEARTTIRDAAGEAIDTLADSMPPEVLFPLLLRSLDVQTPRVREAALDMIATYAPSATSHLSAPTTMRPALVKVVKLLGEKGAEIRRAAIDAVHALHGAAPGVFVAQAAVLPIATQNSLRIAVAPSAPELATQLAALQKPRRPIGRPVEVEVEPPTTANAVESANYTARNTQSRPETLGHPTSCHHAATEAAAYSDTTNGKDSSMPRARTRRAASPRVSGRCGAATGVEGTASETALSHFDPSDDWLAVMPSVLRQLQAGQPTLAQRQALVRMHQIVLGVQADDPVWLRHFEHCLEAALRALAHEENSMRELALACIKDMLRSHAKRFGAFTEHVLLRLLGCSRDATREIAAAAEEALERLISISDPHRCIAVLVPFVMKEPPPTLQLAISLQSRLVGRFSQIQLLAILPQLLPPLFEAFKNSHADVRKAVVFCLVDMYLVLGEQLTPHLAALSTSQLKLVTIYINKTTKARADRLDANHL